MVGAVFIILFSQPQYTKGKIRFYINTLILPTGRKQKTKQNKTNKQVELGNFFGFLKKKKINTTQL